MIFGLIMFVALAAVLGVAQREWDHRHDHARSAKKKGIV